MDYTDEQIRQYLWRCYEQARCFSEDPVTQNGAVLVSADDDFEALGDNGFPTGLVVPKTWKERPLKYKRILHAEETAILSAAANGISTYRATLFCPWAACESCALRIIETGISTLIRHKERMEAYSGRWADEILLADTWMHEAGIEIVTWSGKVGDGMTCLINEEIWYP